MVRTANFRSLAWFCVAIMLAIAIQGCSAGSNSSTTSSEGANDSEAAGELIPVKVALVTRAVSKTPVLIAYDKRIYKKYSLDVTLRMPKGEFPVAIEMREEMDSPDFSIEGGVPMITGILSGRTKRLLLASTDGDVPFNIVGKKGSKSREDLKGKRLDISSDGAMTGFISRLTAKRMAWEPIKLVLPFGPWDS